MLNVFFLIEKISETMYILFELLKFINLRKYELIFINISSEKYTFLKMCHFYSKCARFYINDNKISTM